jgi:hypothetical protein
VAGILHQKRSCPSKVPINAVPVHVEHWTYGARRLLDRRSSKVTSELPTRIYAALVKKAAQGFGPAELSRGSESDPWMGITAYPRQAATGKSLALVAGTAIS